MFTRTEKSVLFKPRNLQQNLIVPQLISWRHVLYSAIRLLQHAWDHGKIRWKTLLMNKTSKHSQGACMLPYRCACCIFLVIRCDLFTQQNDRKLLLSLEHSSSAVAQRFHSCVLWRKHVLNVQNHTAGKYKFFSHSATFVFFYTQPREPHCAKPSMSHGTVNRPSDQWARLQPMGQTTVNVPCCSQCRLQPKLKLNGVEMTWLSRSFTLIRFHAVAQCSYEHSIHFFSSRTVYYCA